MPIPNDLESAFQEAARARDTARAQARREREEERRGDRAQERRERAAARAAPAAAAEVFAWLRGPDAAELRRLAQATRFGRVSLLGPTSEHGDSAPAMHSGTWSVSMSQSPPVLYVAHRAAPAYGFDREVRTAAALARILHPVVLLRLAADIASGRVWRSVKQDVRDDASDG